MLQEEELIYACQERFAREEEECTELVTTASATAMDAISWIDGDCQIQDSTMIHHVAEPDINLFEDKKDNKKSHLARQYR